VENAAIAVVIHFAIHVQQRDGYDFNNFAEY